MGLLKIVLLFLLVTLVSADGQKRHRHRYNGLVHFPPRKYLKPRPKALEYKAPESDYKTPEVSESTYEAPVISDSYKSPEPEYKEPVVVNSYKSPEPEYHASESEYKAPVVVDTYKSPEPEYKVPVVHNSYKSPEHNVYHSPSYKAPESNSYKHPVHNTGHSAPHSQHESEYQNIPPKYQYQYGVKDADHYTDFEVEENRDGAATAGSYRVNLPDGRVQIVTYKADEYGYHADVQYEGIASYPEQKLYEPHSHHEHKPIYN